MVEDLLKRRVFQCRAVDVPRHPVVVKDGRRVFVVVHVVRGAGDPGVVSPALPDELEEVVHAGENVVHEDDRFKVLVFRVAEVVEGAEGRITYFGKVLDAVVERPASAHRRSDGYA